MKGRGNAKGMDSCRAVSRDWPTRELCTKHTADLGQEDGAATATLSNAEAGRRRVLRRALRRVLRRCACDDVGCTQCPRVQGFGARLGELSTGRTWRPWRCHRALPSLTTGIAATLASRRMLRSSPSVVLVVLVVLPFASLPPPSSSPVAPGWTPPAAAYVIHRLVM